MRRDFISKLILGTMISTMVYTLVPIRASAEWVTDYQDNRYYTQNNKKVTGWARIDGQLYYFDDNGKMQTGWIKAGSSWYFLQSNGAVKTGWISYNNNIYYSDSSGVMQTGIINIAGKIYILGDNGVLKTSNTVINGQFYTIGSDGAVAGSKVPTPSKEFDNSGNCVTVLKNEDSNDTDSPTDSNFNDVIEDESEDDADEEEYYGVKYTLTYKDSDGSKLKSKTVKKGKSVDLYEPTKDAYNFVEWNTQSDGSGKSYDDDDDIKVNKDITLYAQWEEDTTEYVTSISISGNSSIVINNTAQMTATVSPSDATTQTVTWSSSNTSIAAVDSSGIVTGIAAGTVTITATATDGSGITGTKEITVTAS